MRTAQVVAQLGGPDSLQYGGDRQHIAQRLAHLLATHGDPAVVEPVSSKPVAGSAALGDLVLVMRKNQIHSTAMDIEFRPQICAGHRRAFQMPAGASAPPRRGPGWLAGFRAFPQREIALVALAGRDSLALMDVVAL